MNGDTLCRAELSDGRTFIFKNVKTTSDTSKAKVSGTTCPAPVCKRVMDLVIVLDKSFSICKNSDYWNRCDLTDWKKIQKFAEGIIDSFEIGEDATMVGIVTFAGEASDVVDISSDKDKIINSLYNVNEMSYATCIGCGIENAIAMFKRVSANREARKPAKMMILMTDGENNKPDQRSLFRYCSTYQPKCKKYNTARCKHYKCTDASPECLKKSTTNCATYKTTNECEKYKCDSCSKRSTTKCLRNQSWCYTYVCKEDSPIPMCGDPDCCSNDNNGNCYNDNYCYWKCRNVQCKEYGKRCAFKECVEYACAEYDCEVCGKNSTTCLEYKKECTEYACEIYNCTNEVCDEYECEEYELECVAYKDGYEGHFLGATSVLHSPYGLLPQSSTPIVSIAIGVGHSIIEAEVKRVASSLEGKKLYYTLDNFDQLAGIIDELVDETCTKMTENLELCSNDCNGLCGCEKKCYCPTCDGGDNCTIISCETKNSQTESLGCVPKPVSCDTDKKCVDVSRDPLVEGCCVETLKSCTHLEDKCHIAYCDNDTGCYTKDVEPTPENACFLPDYCDPYTGWHYKTACPNTSKCFNTVCTLVEGTSSRMCVDIPLCTTDDLCINATCDEETGACTKKPFECPPAPGDLCKEATCYKGQCYYSDNIALRIECANMANSSCEEGYCVPETGKCDVKPSTEEFCDACDSDPINCTNNGTKCQSFRCAVKEGSNETYCEMIADSCPPSADPCITATCVEDENGNGYCKREPVPCVPEGKCNVSVCKIDSTDPTKSYCDPEPKCKSDACYTRTCDEETGACIATPKCEDSLCLRLVSCEIGPDDQPQCTYDPVVCKGDACTYSVCDNKTGTCMESDNSTKCVEDDPCFVYKCNRVTGCFKEPINCDDDDPCTEDKCIPYPPSNSSNSSSSSGSDDDFEDYISLSSSSSYDLNYVCVHRPKCRTKKFCERALCSVNSTCTYVDYNCEDDPRRDTLDTCHTIVCSEGSRSCNVTLLASSFLDVCGSCVKTYGTNATDNVTHAKTMCIGGMAMPEFAAAIGGAAVAAIVIAAIIVAAVVGVSSTIGAKELIKRAKKSTEAVTNTNPLYEGNENEGTNPLYEGDLN